MFDGIDICNQLDQIDWIGQSLHAHPWVFAKTMPDNPHEYSLRKHWDADGFERVVAGIRALGYRYKFGKRYYTQLDINEHYYWTMGAPLPATILINRKRRAPATHPAPYDQAAPGYDDLFAAPEYVHETAAVIERLGDLTALSVLDIGCGTGALLDVVTPGTYVGIDPSWAMLERLRAKHPPSDRVETLYTPLRSFVGRPADRVLALFGTASYLSDEELARIPRLIAPGGRAVLMFYAAHYEPLTHRALGLEALDRRPAPADWPVQRVGNYDLVELRPA